jgi:hypothetical protein
VLYIIKTNDLRYEHLKDYCIKKNSVLYDDKIPINYSFDILFIPLDGIDEFGYIKGTNLKLEKILEMNNVRKIYCGKINQKLLDITKKYNVEVVSLYDDFNFCSNMFNIKIQIIKFFLSEKFQVCYDDLKVLVIGNDYKAYLVSERLSCDIYDCDSISTKAIKNLDLKKYDCVVKMNNYDLEFDQIIIEMCDIDKIDLSYLLKNKNIYYINHLERQYLTKSSAKIMYDSLVKS